MPNIRGVGGPYRPYTLRGRGRYDADNISLSLILIITISKNNEMTVNPMMFLYILYDNTLLSLLLLLYLYTFVRSNPYSPITYPSRGWNNDNDNNDVFPRISHPNLGRFRVISLLSPSHHSDDN